MRIVLFIFWCIIAFLFFAQGGTIDTQAASAIHQILAGIYYIAATVAGVGASVCLCMPSSPE